MKINIIDWAKSATRCFQDDFLKIAPKFNDMIVNVFELDITHAELEYLDHHESNKLLVMSEYVSRYLGKTLSSVVKDE